MGKLLLLLVVFLCIPFLSSAQKDTLKKFRISEAWITFGGGTKIHGALYQTKDSSVLIANSSNKLDL